MHREAPMPVSEFRVPDQLPLLDRGKHRSPRRGACLMELVSYIARERWSDHPGCTHPLLAALARQVNDAMSDQARPRLAVLVPSMIGLTASDPHTEVRVVLRCARTALPVAAADRQRSLAVAVLACERVLNDLDGRRSDRLREGSRQALDQAPHAAAWARDFAGEHRVTPLGFRRHAATGIVSEAVEGIARSGVADVDRVLHDLLVDAIDDFEAVDSGEQAATSVDPVAWPDVCELIGSAPTR